MGKIDKLLIRRIGRNSPRLFDICKEQSNKEDKTILMTIDAYAGEPKNLYDAILFLTYQGFNVIFVGETERG